MENVCLNTSSLHIDIIRAEILSVVFFYFKEKKGGGGHSCKSSTVNIIFKKNQALDSLRISRK